MGLGRYRIQEAGFDYFKEVQFYLQSFLYYAAEINKFVESEITTERERYKAFYLEIQEDPTWEHEWFQYELDLKTKEGLADIYMDSLIISMYSFVERKMLFLCEHFEKGQTFKIKDIAGKGIQRYRRYLEGAAGMDFTQVQTEWAEFLRYNELRNVLVHQVGTRTILRKNHLLIEFLKSSPGVEVDEGSDIITFRFRTNEIIFSFFRCCHFILDFLFVEKVPISRD